MFLLAKLYKNLEYFISLPNLENEKKQSRISARINKYKKYYEKPCELFARLIEGIYLDREWVEAIAPNVTKQFFELLDNGYYLELKHVLDKF